MSLTATASPWKSLCTARKPAIIQRCAVGTSHPFMPTHRIGPVQGCSQKEGSRPQSTPNSCAQPALSVLGPRKAPRAWKATRSNYSYRAITRQCFGETWRNGVTISTEESKNVMNELSGRALIPLVQLQPTPPL